MPRLSGPLCVCVKEREGGREGGINHFAWMEPRHRSNILGFVLIVSSSVGRPSPGRMEAWKSDTDNRDLFIFFFFFFVSCSRLAGQRPPEQASRV